MIGFAANVFHWSASEFFASTPHEYFSAYAMWREMNPPRDSNEVK